MISILSRKRCSKCKVWKDNKEFYKDKYEPDGLTKKCKVCAKAATRKWEKNNPNKANAKAHRNYNKDRSGHSKKVREWQKSNPHKIRQYKRQRRARIRNVGGTITEVEWVTLIRYHDNKCLRCMQRFTDDELTLDHVIPLVKDGAHSIENSQPLCRSCNSIKGISTTDYR